MAEVSQLKKYMRQQAWERLLGQKTTSIDALITAHIDLMNWVIDNP